MYYVYILKCSNGTFYKGCTSNLDERIKRHKQGYIKYTQSRLPIELVTYIVFSDQYRAFEFEKYLKSGFGSFYEKEIDLISIKRMEVFFLVPTSEIKEVNPL